MLCRGLSMGIPMMPRSRLSATPFLRCMSVLSPAPPPPQRAAHTTRGRRRRNTRTLASTSTPSAMASPNTQSESDTATATATASDTDSQPQQSWLGRLFSREASVAPEGYNRLAVVPAAFLVQLSIGSVYAWSTFNAALTTDMGVVTAAADDWTLSQIVPVFSLCAGTLGVTTAVLGPWAERVGPRRVAATAGVLWSSGLALSGVGVMTHTLPLLLFGYGILGGAGWALGYVSPVSTLIKWFPDRRGVAAGLGLCAFGGGAMVAAPINDALLNHFRQLPDYLGPESSVRLVSEGGRRFADIAGELKEVVVASASDVAAMPGVSEGVYLVGTGNSGAAMTFLTLGGSYLAAMTVGAFGMRVPRDGWMPSGYTPPTDADTDTDAAKAASSMISTRDVHYNTAMRTPAFYLLWTAVACNAVAGVTVMSCAKTMMGEIFSTALPAIVTGSFAASYVAMLSAGNMVGRLGWATASDYLGRRNTYFLFGAGIPLIVSLPVLTSMVSTSPSTLPLYAFVGGSFVLLTFYGGVFSVLPAFIADLFGSKHVGAIHGRLLTAWSAAAIGGPTLLTTLRSRDSMAAINDLVSRVDPHAFQAKFGAPMEELHDLVVAKTVTVGKLMEIAPLGTADPTPMLYDSSLYAMGGILGVAFVSTALIRPVDPKYWLPVDAPSATKADDK